ncbi:MAG: cytochrome c oxidase accessory protein CcoG [Runella sp.]
MKAPQIHTDDFRDTLSNVTETGKRIWIYPRIEVGQFYKLRTAVAWVLLGVLFGLPWLKINEKQAFLFNILERKFIIFGVTFFPQDFHLVAIGLITFMVFIILFTVVYGRVWCGWACPQTIFMEMVFRKIENLIEGDHNAQRRLDAMPLNWEKFRKKALKHSIFFAVSFLIANTFLAYLIGKDELIRIIGEPLWLHWGKLLSLLIFTSVFYFVFARFRELVCIVVCPYGRLQGVLLDKKSMVVAYDWVRGEPRGKKSKQREIAPSKGDCIDCGICVQVCPTGIDIRNGTQLECIGCTACIDACDHVMDKIQRPRGLIRYDSLDGIANGQRNIFSTRVMAYTAVLAALLSVLAFLLLTRNDYEMTLLRAPGLTYQIQTDGKVSNLYHLQIVNKTSDEVTPQLKMNKQQNGEVRIVGQATKIEPSEVGNLTFFVDKPRREIRTGSQPIEVEVWINNQHQQTLKTTFLAP